MCGIVGVMTAKLTLGDYLKFKDLFTVAQLRGDDGSGIMSVPAKSPVAQVKVRKSTWSSGHLVTTSEWDEAIKGDNSILVGHARQPTKGASKIENVHPHRSGNIILVHNGTMSTVDNSTLGVNESDSKKIAETINKKGIRHFVDSSFGAYCLIWVDLEKQTLNFLRNEERPLWLFEQKMSNFENSSVTHLWWASEFWMIPTIQSRYVGYNKDHFHAKTLPVNTHLEFPLDVAWNIPMPEGVEMKRKVHYSSAVYNDDWEGYNENSPFYQGVHDAVTSAQQGSNSNGQTTGRSVVAMTSGTGGSQGPTQPFRYTPPERRATTTPVRSAGSIIAASRIDAGVAAKRKEADKSVGTFSCETSSKGPSLLEAFAEKQPKRILELIGSGKCVWCGDQPLTIDGVHPKVYPVRFTESRNEYVCSGCINDLDVQRMVGIS